MEDRHGVSTFLMGAWGRLLLAFALVAILLGVCYQALIVYPDKKTASQQPLRWHERAWEVMREPVPEVDKGLEERNAAWDEIQRKQDNPGYTIPPFKLQLIKKHWTKLTSDWTPEQVESLKRKLGLPP